MNDDETGEDLLRRRLINAARGPTARPDLQRIRRGAVMWRMSVAGGGVAIIATLAVFATVLAHEPAGPTILSAPAGQDHASEPTVATPSELPSPSRSRSSSRSPSDSPPPTGHPKAQVTTDEAEPASPASTPQTEPSEPRSVPPPTVVISPAPSPTPAKPAATEATDETDHGAHLWGRRFLVVEVTDKGEVTRPSEDDPWTTHFTNTQNGMDDSDGQVGWRWGGCNAFGAPIDVSEDRLHVGGMGGTAAGCDDSEGQARDAWSQDFFAANPQWSLDGDRLRMWSGDVIVELVED